MSIPHCPHCLLPISGADRLPYPAAAMRCPNCRLIVGAGRARAEASEDGDARSRGSAAGVLANAARRAQSAPGDAGAITAALCTIADAAGCSVERLRMLDYQTAAERDPELPDLSVVLATHSTWKAARSAAATASEMPAVEAGDEARMSALPGAA